MKYLIAIFAVMLAGCGTARNKIDPILEPYYNDFIAESSQYGKSLDYNQGLTITFGDVPQDSQAGSTIGVCYRDDSLIVVSKAAWDTSPEESKKLLIFHELGHCVLGLSHTQVPASIMYPDLGVFKVEYAKYSQQMLADLFR